MYEIKLITKHPKGYQFFLSNGEVEVRCISHSHCMNTVKDQARKLVEQMNRREYV
jgi:hypothetical protein